MNMLIKEFKVELCKWSVNIENCRKSLIKANSGKEE